MTPEDVKRREQVARLWGNGKSIEHIAEHLVLSEATVRNDLAALAGEVAQ